MRAPFMTIQSAAVELRKDPRYIRGMVAGLGIELTPIASGLVMSREDYERLRERVEADSTRPDASVTTAVIPDPNRPVEV